MSRLRAALVLSAALFPASASAAAPPADFLAAWENSDRLLAQSDIVGSLNAIEPLFARRGELEAGSAERHWFNYSARRILFVVGRDKESDSFNVGEVPLPNQSTEPTPTPSTAACPTDPQGPRRVTIPNFVDNEWIPNGRSPQFMGGWFRDRGYYATTQSYFAGVTQQPKTVTTPTPVTWCNLLPIRQDGAPLGMWPSQGLGRAAAIPATSPFMTTRRIAPSGTVAAQVFGPKGTRFRAAWTPRGGGKEVQRALAVNGYSTVVTAPKGKGRYTLNIQITFAKSKTKKAEWITVSQVYGVGVGTAPAPYPSPKPQPSVLDGPGGGGR